MNEQMWFDDLNEDSAANLADEVHDDGEHPLDFALLMSLALDDLLDDEQQNEFERDLATYPMLAERWSLWQKVDQKLLEEPHQEPPHNFVSTFEARLAKQKRRRSLWFGMAIGSLSVTLWVCMTIGLIAGGGYILLNQGDLLGQAIHNFVYFSNAITNWLTTISGAAGTVLNTPQAYGIVLGYIALSAIILTVWTQFLRRSTMSQVAS